MGTRVRLRGVEPDDWTAFMRFAEDEERLGDLLNPPRSAEGFRAWAKEQASAKSDDDCFQLAVEAVDTGELVGAVGSHHVDPRAGWFEYGVTIGADSRRKGYAAEAVVLLLRFIVEEGRLRDHVFLAGQHRGRAARAATPRPTTSSSPRRRWPTAAGRAPPRPPRAAFRQAARHARLSPGRPPTPQEHPWPSTSPLSAHRYPR